MRTLRLFMMAVTGLAAVALGATQASDPQKPGACEPGYRWEQVTEYREVCRDVCRTVPDVKKTSRWVYSQVDDPFCLKHSGCCNSDCATCNGPYCRKQLVKKLVTCEEPTTKCVVEKVVEKVPCTVYRKVACAESCAPAACARPFCCFRKHRQEVVPGLPAAPTPVEPGKKMPEAGKSNVNAFPTVPATVPPASLAEPQSQPLPSGAPR